VHSALAPARRRGDVQGGGVCADCQSNVRTSAQIENAQTASRRACVTSLGGRSLDKTRLHGKCATTHSAIIAAGQLSSFGTHCIITRNSARAAAYLLLPLARWPPDRKLRSVTWPEANSRMEVNDAMTSTSMYRHYGHAHRYHCASAMTSYLASAPVYRSGLDPLALLPPSNAAASSRTLSDDRSPPFYEPSTSSNSGLRAPQLSSAAAATGSWRYSRNAGSAVEAVHPAATPPHSNLHPCTFCYLGIVAVWIYKELPQHNIMLLIAMWGTCGPSCTPRSTPCRGGTRYEKLRGRKISCAKRPKYFLQLPSHYSSLPPLIGAHASFAPPPP